MKKLLLLAALAGFLSLSAGAADLQKLMNDTQRMLQEPSNITLVWWIPTDFWDMTLREDPQITDDKRAEFTKMMSDYMVFAVVSVDVGPMGGMTPRGRRVVEENTELKIGGRVVAPLDDKGISPDTLNFISIMKPMMANMLGQFGQGIEFLLYPNPAPGGRKLAATEDGEFSYTAFGRQFDWRLPLGSLLPPKIDPKTKQEFPGDYIYNPYTGAKLVVR